jgi:hypothetical protein
MERSPANTGKKEARQRPNTVNIQTETDSHAMPQHHVQAVLCHVEQLLSTIDCGFIKIFIHLH